MTFQDIEIYLFTGIFLLGFISAIFSKSLTSVSGTRLNFYFRKKGLETVDNNILEALENSGVLFFCIDQICRLAFIGILVSSFFFSAYTVPEIITISAIFLFLLLVFMEIVPEMVSNIFPEKLIVCFVGVFYFLGRGFAPVVKMYDSVIHFLIRTAGGDVAKQAEQALEEEILSAVEEGEREGLIKRGGKDMIESIISFYDVEVKEVMTPRTSMVCFSDETVFTEGIAGARKCGHSRIPVYRGNKDNIIGILYVKDFLGYLDKLEEKGKTIGTILRKAYFVPESKKVSKLFQEFRSQRFHIAIVLDEYGGTMGLVTIEDILEEIVGEIADEYETHTEGEDAMFRKVSEKMAEADGLIHLDELNEFMGLELPEDDSYETLAGFLFTLWGRIPMIGEKILFKDLEFEIIDANERQIKSVRIKKLNT